MKKSVRMIIVALLACAIILSCTVVGSKLTNPNTYTNSIETLDKSRTTLLEMSAAAAGASAVISIMPDDVCSSLSDELSEFSTWFLIILAVVFLEKYLLTIFAGVACYVLIPAGCLGLLITMFYPNGFIRKFALKFVALGLVLVCIIPVSVKISNKISDIYSESIEVTVESAKAVTDDLSDSTIDEDGNDSSIVDKAAGILDDLSSSAANVVSKFKNIINRFIEATAIMLVINCLIPVLVFVFLVWFINKLFDVNIIMPQPFVAPCRPHTQEKGLLIESIEETETEER